MLLWEIDRSLTELTQLYGFERASRAYRGQPACRRRAEIAGAATRPSLRHARQGFAVSGGRQHQQGVDRGASAAPARRPAGRFPRPCDAARCLRHHPRRRHRVAGRGRCRPDAIGARAARDRRCARRPGVRGRSRGIRCRGALGRRSLEERPRDRGAIGGSRDRLCHARHHRCHRPFGFVELGHCHDAAAAEHLEGRRADLGRQQGLSLRPKHRRRTHHHRRRGQR